MKRLSIFAVVAMLLVSLVSCEKIEGTVLSGKTYCHEEYVGGDSNMYLAIFLEFGNGDKAKITSHVPGVGKEVYKDLTYTLSEDNIVNVVYSKGEFKGQNWFDYEGVYNPATETIDFTNIVLQLKK